MREQNFEQCGDENELELIQSPFKIGYLPQCASQETFISKQYEASANLVADEIAERLHVTSLGVGFLHRWTFRLRTRECGQLSIANSCLPGLRARLDGERFEAQWGFFSFGKRTARFIDRDGTV